MFGYQQQLMNFVEMVAQKKSILLAGLGACGVLAIGLKILYEKYKIENKIEAQASQQELNQQAQNKIVQNTKKVNKEHYDLDKQIQALKLQIDLGNLSLQDIKTIIAFSMTMAKREVTKRSKQLKENRIAFSPAKRNANFEEYLNMIKKGLLQVQRIGISFQQQIMQKIGVKQSDFLKYNQQLAPFMEEQMMGQMMPAEGAKDFTLQQVKQAIQLQIQCMKNKGEILMDKIVQATQNWSPNDKQNIPAILSTVIADEAFDDHPEIDQEEMQGAEMKYQAYLQDQLKELQETMAPMMQKLLQKLGGSMGGMAGMGGMGGMGGMEGMGGMGGMEGAAMEQLQKMRIQDPAGFQQLMQMMQMQMGMGMGMGK